MVSVRSAWLLFFLLAPAAWAGHVSECEPTSSYPEIDTGATPAGRTYVDFHVDQHWLIISTIWVYEEANGIEGLQRFDEWHDDTCGHPERADRIVY